MLVSAKNCAPLSPAVSKASAGAMEAAEVHAAKMLRDTLVVRASARRCGQGGAAAWVRFRQGYCKHTANSMCAGTYDAGGSSSSLKLVWLADTIGTGAAASGWLVLGAAGDAAAQSCQDVNVDRPTIIVLGEGL
eukprot:scaffold107681_cov17-Tisochrysis_lutea.AAC.1